MDTPVVRELHDHQAMDWNEQVRILVVDPPGAGNASHVYQIDVPDGPRCIINFQNGPVGEVGVNGLSNEALIAVVMDRLRSFQQGSYACRENACALTKLEEGLHWLQSRTNARVRRGVEGKSIV